MRNWWRFSDNFEKTYANELLDYHSADKTNLIVFLVMLGLFLSSLETSHHNLFCIPYIIQVTPSTKLYISMIVSCSTHCRLGRTWKMYVIPEKLDFIQYLKNYWITHLFINTPSSNTAPSKAIYQLPARPSSYSWKRKNQRPGKLADPYGKPSGTDSCLSPWLAGNKALCRGWRPWPSCLVHNLDCRNTQADRTHIRNPRNPAWVIMMTGWPWPATLLPLSLPPSPLQED